LRSESPTYGQHFAVTLSAENRKMLYIPETFAHGFLTLQDDTEVFYLMSEFHVPASARGFRWNDPFFDIHLPMEVTVISRRDRDYPNFHSPG
jgi:dTDP-4-dehydrorhamnose 3,5-epimerase